MSANQPQAFLEPRVSRGLAVGDYNNDGFPDFLVNNNGEQGQLFRNSAAEGKHWIGVRLRGDQSSRDGRGAKLKVVAGSHLSYDQAMGGRSYCSAQDSRILFGLQSRAEVDALEIQWLSGKRQVFLDLPSDRYINVKEGAAE